VASARFLEGRAPADASLSACAAVSVIAATARADVASAIGDDTEDRGNHRQRWTVLEPDGVWAGEHGVVFDTRHACNVTSFAAVPDRMIGLREHAALNHLMDRSSGLLFGMGTDREGPLWRECQ